MSGAHIAWLVSGWTFGWYLFWRLPRLPRSSSSAPTARPGAHPDVAVIVPARDEEHALPHLLDGLIGADPRVAEVVVVDDGSTDRTGAVARAAGARVVHPGPPPPGSTGKSWACTSGARATSSPLLVFVDADVTFSPGGLTAVIDELARTGGLLSVEPFQRVEHRYERLSALFGVVSVMGTGAASPGHRRLRTAFGPVLACRRADYEALGGHAAEPGAIAEDVALAARFDAAGHDVSILGGGDLVSFRMYPCGPRQLVEGWSKNMATGAGTTASVRLAATVVWMGALISSAIGLVEGAVALGARGEPSDLVVGLAVAAAFAVQLQTMFRQIGRFGRQAAAAYPVLVVAFLAIFVRSLYLTAIRREVRWKGRSIPLQPSHPDP